MNICSHTPLKITGTPTAVWVFGLGDVWLCKTTVSEAASAVNTKVEICLTLLLQVENKAAPKILIYMYLLRIDGWWMGD